jgi:hypothetical protein
MLYIGLFSNKLDLKRAKVFSHTAYSRQTPVIVNFEKNMQVVFQEIDFIWQKIPRQNCV